MNWYVVLLMLLLLLFSFHFTEMDTVYVKLKLFHEIPDTLCLSIAPCLSMFGWPQGR